MNYGAVAVAVLGILVTILASLAVWTVDRLAKEADKNVKLAMKLMDMAAQKKY